jgi:nitroreductase
VFLEDQVKQVLGIPANVRVVQLLALGYPKSAPEAKPRKALNEIVCYDRWS